jgi:outer membrane lipoprotein-sorting protein
MNFRATLAGAMLLISVFAAAADKEVEELLASMRSVYEKTKTAKLQTETLLNIEDKEIKSEFDIQFKSPNMVKMTTDNIFGLEARVTLKCDGKMITVTSPDEKEETPFTLEELSSAMPVNLETMSFWDWKRQLSTDENGNMRKSEFRLLKDQEWNDKKWTVLEETANEQEVFVRYWINPETKYIWKTEVLELKSREKVMTCTIKKLEVNVEIDDSVFGG